MAKKMLIDATHAEETRVVVVDGNKVEEFDFESLNKRQLAGNIYLAKVTRVEPSLQAAFVDYGGNRHGFLAFTEIHPDYYQIPVADREALLAEERAYAKAQEEEAENPTKRRRSRRSRSKPAKTEVKDALVTEEVVETTAETGETPEAVEAVEAAQTGDDAPAVEAQVEAPAEAEAETATQEDAAKAEPAADADKGAIPGMDVVDIDPEDSEPVDGFGEESAEAPSASERDETIESVADEDVSEEIRPRKPRPRRYKIQEVVKDRQIL